MQVGVPVRCSRPRWVVEQFLTAAAPLLPPQYSLIKDVVSSLKRHRMHEQQFTQHPLLVLSNFGLQQIHVKLMASMFQNMFPSINVHKVRGVQLREPPPSVGLVSPPNSSFSLQVNLNNIKRCLLISYDAETQLLDFRH